MIGLIEFAQKMQEPEKRRRVGIAAAGLAGYGGVNTLAGAHIAAGKSKLHNEVIGQGKVKKFGRQTMMAGGAMVAGGAYLQHRRNKKLRAQGYTAGNPLMAKKPMKPPRSI